MLAPTARELPGTVMTALPLLSVVAADVYVPLVMVTEPVGVPPPPLTVTVTMVDCAAEILAGDGETATVGVVSVVTADP